MGLGRFLLHGLLGLPVILSLLASAVAWYAYLRNPCSRISSGSDSNGLYTLLVNKYYFDEFNEKVIARGGRAIGGFLWRVGDVALIDGAVVNGSARLVGWCRRSGSAGADRLSVSLRLRDDHRFVRAGGLDVDPGLRPPGGISSSGNSEPIDLAADSGRVARPCHRPWRVVAGAADSAPDRWLALLTSIGTFGVSLQLYTGFDRTTWQMQFVERAPWIPQFNVEYFLGVDGFSMPLILLTTFLTPLVVDRRLGDDQGPAGPVFRVLS